MFISGREIREPYSWILGLLAITFSIGKIQGVLDPKFYISSTFIGIILGFVVHELAHRTVGANYGFKTEFVAFTPGLLITFLTGFIPGIAILTPGYVKTTIYSYNFDRKAFINSVAAGPESNIAISIISLILYYIIHQPILIGIAQINAWIAFFNLIPVPPLDGSKIMRGAFNRWIIDFAASLLLLIL